MAAVSFLPIILINEYQDMHITNENKILNICQILNIGSPCKDKYSQVAIKNFENKDLPLSNNDIMNRFTKNITTEKEYNSKKKNITALINSIDTTGIINIKETKSFDLLYSNNSQIQELPDDNFNIICNKVIECIIIEKEVKTIDIEDDKFIISGDVYDSCIVTTGASTIPELSESNKISLKKPKVVFDKYIELIERKSNNEIDFSRLYSENEFVAMDIPVNLPLNISDLQKKSSFYHILNKSNLLPKYYKLNYIIYFSTICFISN